MVELDLDGVVHSGQACQVRWWVALREMLRKRALVAGEASSLLPLHLTASSSWVLVLCTRRAGAKYRQIVGTDA